MVSQTSSQTCTHSGGMANMPASLTQTPTWTTSIVYASSSDLTDSPNLEPRYATWDSSAGIFLFVPDGPTATPTAIAPAAATATAASDPAPSNSNSSGSGLSKGALAGLIIGLVVAAALALWCCCCCCRKSGSRGGSSKRTGGHRSGRGGGGGGRARGGGGYDMGFAPVYIQRPQPAYRRY